MQMQLDEPNREKEHPQKNNSSEKKNEEYKISERSEEIEEMYLNAER